MILPRFDALHSAVTLPIVDLFSPLTCIFLVRSRLPNRLSVTTPIIIIISFPGAMTFYLVLDLFPLQDARSAALETVIF